MRSKKSELLSAIGRAEGSRLGWEREAADARDRHAAWRRGESLAFEARYLAAAAWWEAEAERTVEGATVTLADPRPTPEGYAWSFGFYRLAEVPGLKPMDFCAFRHSNGAGDIDFAEPGAAGTAAYRRGIAHYHALLSCESRWHTRFGSLRASDPDRWALLAGSIRPYTDFRTWLLLCAGTLNREVAARR